MTNQQIARTWLEREKQTAPFVANAIDAVLSSPKSMDALADVIGSVRPA